MYFCDTIFYYTRLFFSFQIFGAFHFQAKKFDQKSLSDDQKFKRNQPNGNEMKKNNKKIIEREPIIMCIIKFRVKI